MPYPVTVLPGAYSSVLLDVQGVRVGWCRDPGVRERKVRTRYALLEILKLPIAHHFSRVFSFVFGPVAGGSCDEEACGEGEEGAATRFG